jgi:hypothetical protein
MNWKKGLPSWNSTGTALYEGHIWSIILPIEVLNHIYYHRIQGVRVGQNQNEGLVLINMDSMFRRAPQSQELFNHWRSTFIGHVLPNAVMVQRRS